MAEIRKALLTSAGNLHDPRCPRIKNLKRPPAEVSITPEMAMSRFGAFLVDGRNRWVATCCTDSFAVTTKRTWEWME